MTGTGAGVGCGIDVGVDGAGREQSVSAKVRGIDKSAASRTAMTRPRGSYFLRKARTVSTMLIALRMLIMPAGINLCEWKNFGMN